MLRFGLLGWFIGKDGGRERKQHKMNMSDP